MVAKAKSKRLAQCGLISHPHGHPPASSAQGLAAAVSPKGWTRLAQQQRRPVSEEEEDSKPDCRSTSNLQDSP